MKKLGWVLLGLAMALASQDAIAQDNNLLASESIRCFKETIPVSDRIAACRIMDSAGVTHTTFPIYLNTLIHTYMAKGQYPEAIAAASEALKIVQVAPLFNARAEAYALNGDYKDALDDSAYALYVDHNGYDSLNGRCWMRAVSNNELDLALDDCNKAIGLSPDDANILDSRGLVQFRRGDYADAISDTSAALAINPRMPSSLYVRGLSKLKTGDTAGGEADISAAKVLYKDIAEMYARYGVKP
jgi:tetratricopeptide (TPR) repeat protein